MRLVRAERNGEAFDSQLVIGVRESYGNNPFMLNSIVTLILNYLLKVYLKFQ